MRRFVRILLLLTAVGLLFSGCHATPAQADLERVKKHFLAMRFQAPFSKELKNLNDADLFQMSCEANRVRCAPLLDMLKQSDPKFFETLKKP